jgi:hypothetical protein
MKTYSDRLDALESEVRELKRVLCGGSIEHYHTVPIPESERPSVQRMREAMRAMNEHTAANIRDGHQMWCVRGLPDYRQPESPDGKRPLMSCNCGRDGQPAETGSTIPG